MKPKKTKNGNIIAAVLETNNEEISALPIKFVRELSNVPVHWAHNQERFPGPYTLNNNLVYECELLLKHPNYSDAFLQRNCIIRVYASRIKEPIYEVHFKVQRSDFIILPL